MGPTRENLNFRQIVNEDNAIFVPAGTWHNVVNHSNESLKILTIYAPPHHRFGTVHQTKKIAQEQDLNY